MKCGNRGVSRYWRVEIAECKAYAWFEGYSTIRNDVSVVRKGVEGRQKHLTHVFACPHG
jgi:hypothetical protein